MKIQVLGSGGFLPIPRATCGCRICQVARKKGWPYKRRGPACYLPAAGVLFDTPEDINDSLNFSKIGKVSAIIYTHWHPDHTLGYRVIETICDNDFNRNNKKSIPIYLPSYDVENFRKIIPGLWHLESRGYVTIHEIDTLGIKIKNMSITPVRLGDTTYSAYLIREGSKRAILCLDHAMHLPSKKELGGIDLLVMSMGYFLDKVRGASRIQKSHRLVAMTGFEKDNLRIIKELKPKKTVFVHIEEKYNRTNAELRQLEQKYKNLNIMFAVDGQIIVV